LSEQQAELSVRQAWGSFRSGQASDAVVPGRPLSMLK
jgi:hypothetical protein